MLLPSGVRLKNILDNITVVPRTVGLTKGRTFLIPRTAGLLEFEEVSSNQIENLLWVENCRRSAEEITPDSWDLISIEFRKL